jgi:hypothetical protein
MENIKQCTRCSQFKEKNMFYVRKQSKDGLTPNCKNCIKEIGELYYKSNSENIKNRVNAYRIDNKPVIKLRKHIYYMDNKDSHLKKTNKWRKDNPEKAKKSREKYVSNNKEKETIRYITYQKNNKGKVNATTRKRQAKKLNATPKWLTKDDFTDIEIVYKVCAWLNSWKIEKFHVDHIIPLQGENVSGLHVPWNLQILTAEENIRKGNKYNELP